MALRVVLAWVGVMVGGLVLLALVDVGKAVARLAGRLRPLRKSSVQSKG